jgi:mono/diheme cytochrome c family protein
MTTKQRILAASLLLAGALASIDLSAEGFTNPFGMEPGAAAEGKKLFMSAGCVACHGNNARGAVGPDLTDDEWLRPFSEEMVFNTIKNGRPDTLMSPFRGDLSDEQIWKLVTYLLDEGRKRKAAEQ